MGSVSNGLGMRMATLWTGHVTGRAIEVGATIPAMVPDRQDLHLQRRSFGDGAARDKIEGAGQLLWVEDTAGRRWPGGWKQCCSPRVRVQSDRLTGWPVRARP